MVNFFYFYLGLFLFFFLSFFVMNTSHSFFYLWKHFMKSVWRAYMQTDVRCEWKIFWIDNHGIDCNGKSFLTNRKIKKKKLWRVEKNLKRFLYVSWFFLLAMFILIFHFSYQILSTNDELFGQVPWHLSFTLRKFMRNHARTFRTF